MQAEIAALHHQLRILQRRTGARPRLRSIDRILWAWLSRLWSGWRRALVIVKPETVLAWHRRGFQLYWRWKSRKRGPGRPKASPDVRALIRKMSLSNPGWGAPRIHGELLKLGIDIGETSVGQYMVRCRRPPSQTWRTFFDNHLRQLVAVDFFVVPTLTFRVLFVFVVLGSRSMSDSTFQRHVSPHRGMDRAADSGGLSVGDGPSIPAARSGRNLWQGLPGLCEGDGRRRGQDRAAEPLAESFRGAPDRFHSPRVLGPCDRLQRAIAEATPTIVRRLLSPFSNASLARQGCAGDETSPTAGDWPRDRDAGCRRAASSLPAERGLRNRDTPSSGSRWQPKKRFAHRTATRQTSAWRSRIQTSAPHVLAVRGVRSSLNHPPPLPEFGLSRPDEINGIHRCQRRAACARPLFRRGNRGRRGQARRFWRRW